MDFSLTDEQAAIQATVKQFTDERILPTMDEWEVVPRIAAAVGVRAQAQNVARLSLSAEDIQHRAAETITNARETTQLLMREKLIPAAD